MSIKYSVVFFDIDTQYDFMDPNGALHVQGAEQIVPNLQRLIAAANIYNIPLISTADYHDPHDPEFDAFPPHCVRGTLGQQHLPATLLISRVALDPQETVTNLADLLQHYPQIILRKQTINIWTSAAARQVLSEVDADAWYVFGVATDYCVKSAALGLVKAAKPTYVVTDAVKAITPAGEVQAIQEMQAAGVRFVTTNDVLETVRTRKPLE